MAIQNISISSTSRTWARGSTTRRSVLPQDTGRRNLTSTAMIPDEHVTLKGFPFTPQFLVSSNYEVTADGTYVDEQTYPWEAVFEEEHTRFIAQENLWDDTANQWLPFTSAGVNYQFVWSGLTEPRLEEVEYRIGKLLYTHNSVRLEEDTSRVP